MVGHAGGKHQSRVIVPVQAVEPGRHAGQEAGPPFGLPVGRQRPAARDGLRPQVHHVQEVVVEKEREHLAEAEQGQVAGVLGLYHPAGRDNRGNITTHPSEGSLFLHTSLNTSETKMIKAVEEFLCV